MSGRTRDTDSPASVLPPSLPGRIQPPADTPEYMWPAWAGCLHWALGEPDIIAAFRADTGNQWQPGRSGIDRMIDEATGADREFAAAFIDWFNVNVWGAVDG